MSNSWSGRAASGHTPIQAPTILVRTSLHQKIGDYLPSLPHTADTEIWLRMAAHGVGVRAERAAGVPAPAREEHEPRLLAGAAARGAEEGVRHPFRRVRRSAHPEIALCRRWWRAPSPRRRSGRAPARSTTATPAMCRDFLAFAAAHLPGDRVVVGVAPAAPEAPYRRARLARLSPVMSRVKALSPPGPSSRRRGPDSERSDGGQANGVAAQTARRRRAEQRRSADRRRQRRARSRGARVAAGRRFLLCGPLEGEFQQEAARRGIATRHAVSRIFSKRELPLYALDVCRWIARLTRGAPTSST